MFSFNGVEVEAEVVTKGKTRQLSMGKQETLTTMSWASLPSYEISQSEPAQIDLVISASAEDEAVTVYTAQHGTMLPLNGGGRRLKVPVTWNEGVPHTRRINEDNLDVVFLDQKGGYMNIQVSLVTRAGKFFVCAQVVAQGKIVRRKEGYDFVPTAPEFAFPGASFADTWPNLASSMGNLAKKLKISPAKKDDHIDWQPPVVPKNENWRSGVVMYFNMVTGIGRIKDVDGGGEYFVHFKTIISPLELPVLELMTGAHFKLRDGERGPQVKSVRAVN